MMDDAPNIRFGKRLSSLLIDYQDVVVDRPWCLLNRTVLSRMVMTDSNNEDAVEFVDLYVMNPNGRKKGSGCHILLTRHPLIGDSCP